MAKTRTPDNYWLSVISIGIVVAALFGIAYLANNTTGSQAATPAAVSTNPADYQLPRSPYPECQAILDEANRRIISDTTYHQLLDRLGQLLQERQSLYDILRDRNATAEERRAAQIRLLILNQQIREAQIAVNEYRSRIFAEYNQCLAEARSKRQPTSWWRSLFNTGLNRLTTR